MSGSCRRMPLFKDLKLRREEEKRESTERGGYLHRGPRPAGAKGLVQVK
jgi:hypothetical protein